MPGVSSFFSHWDFTNPAPRVGTIFLADRSTGGDHGAGLASGAGGVRAGGAHCPAGVGVAAPGQCPGSGGLCGAPGTGTRALSPALCPVSGRHCRTPRALSAHGGGPRGSRGRAGVCPGAGLRRGGQAASHPGGQCLCAVHPGPRPGLWPALRLDVRVVLPGHAPGILSALDSAPGGLPRFQPCPGGRCLAGGPGKLSGLLGRSGDPWADRIPFKRPCPARQPEPGDHPGGYGGRPWPGAGPG